MKKKKTGKSAMDSALDYLTSRPRTVREMENYLDGQNYGEYEVYAAVERLKELKYLDDVRYAADFVSTRLATKPLSRRKLKEQLRTHYLSSDDIDAAMKQVTDDVERRNAMTVAEKFYRQFEGLEEYDRRQRIVRRLAGRGYDFGVIRDSVEELIGAIDCPLESDVEDEE